MSKPSFRVYFIPHGDASERLWVGILMRTWDSLFDSPPPSAIGATADDVLAELEREILSRSARAEDSIERYLWEEHFDVHEVSVTSHPLTTVKKRPVIGKQEIPMRLFYAACPMKDGGYRVMLPRFGGFFVLEDLSLAAEVLRNAVSSWLCAAEPRALYDFRSEGAEYVRAWHPPLLDRLPPKRDEETDQDTFPALTRVADDLVALARKNRLPPVVGDSVELDRFLKVRAKGVPPSILLVGAPGVGKTTFVRRLARAYSKSARAKDAPRAPRIWSTSADRILAGMVYLGMWQERCLQIVSEIEGEGDYLYVAALLPILQSQPDGTSIAEMFEGPLSAGQMSLIAECTPAELARAERADASFVSRFQIIRIAEPSATATLALLDPYAAKKKAPALHPAGAKRAVELLGATMRAVAFPGKALRFVDWLAADQRERRTSLGKASDEDGSEPSGNRLGPREITEAFSRYSGIPLDLISDDVSAGSDHFAERLSSRVVGQDEACRTCARILARFKARLHDPMRPTASLLFVGPTGVGKTELAKQLARTMFGDVGRLVRIDMSEYATWGSAARLVDVSPGTRSLARAVAEQPLSVVLLDEIEKAHSDVFDLLLGVLDEGRLTDASGRLVDMRGTVIVMTSNLGATDRTRASFTRESAADFRRAVRDHFRPELRNRIDYVIEFNPLTPGDVLRIVDMDIAAIADRTGLVRRQVRLVVEREAKDLLAELGHHPTRGARPLKRVIEERLVVPIAAALAADPSRRGFELRVTRRGDDLVLHTGAGP